MDRSELDLMLALLLQDESRFARVEESIARGAQRSGTRKKFLVSFYNLASHLQSDALYLLDLELSRQSLFFFISRKGARFLLLLSLIFFIAPFFPAKF